jgi:hypothetical protein
VIASRSGARIASARRQHEAVGPAHQEVVVQEHAQPMQRVAHRRLRAAEPRAGAGEGALGDLGVEHFEEVEVEAAEIHAKARHSAYECRLLLLSIMKIEKCSPNVSMKQRGTLFTSSPGNRVRPNGRPDCKIVPVIPLRLAIVRP